MEALEDSASREQSRPHGHPPDLRTFQKLPQEVLCRILDKVQEGDLELESEFELVRTRPRSLARNRLMRVRQVSRMFRAAADSSVKFFYLRDPSPWGAGPTPDDQGPDPEWSSRVRLLLLHLVPRWPHLTTLFLGLRYRRQDLSRALSSLAPACPHLEHLHLDARFAAIPPQKLPAHALDPLLGAVASLPRLASLSLYAFRSYARWWAGFPPLPHLKELLLVACGSFELTLPAHVALVRLCRNNNGKARPCVLHLTPCLSLRELRINCVYSIGCLHLPTTLEVLSLDTVEIRGRGDPNTQLPKLAKLELVEMKLDTLPWLTTSARTCLFSLTSLRLDQVTNARAGITLHDLPTLLSLEIRQCESVRTVPPLPPTLRSLLLDDLPLRGLSGLASASRLQQLTVRGCAFLKQCSDIASLTALETLALDTAAIKALPNLVALVHLRSLSLSECEELTHVELPRTHTSLTHVTLESLWALTSFHASPALRHLAIRNGTLLPPPTDFHEYPSLEELTLEACEGIAVDLTHLSSLKKATLRSLSQLEHLPAGLEVLAIIWRHPAPQAPETMHLSSFPKLRELHLQHWFGVVTLRLVHQPELRKLVVSNCRDLEVIETRSLPKLQSLRVTDCGKLREVDLTGAPCVTDLKLKDCGELKVVKGLQGLSPFAAVEIKWCGVEKDELMAT